MTVVIVTTDGNFVQLAEDIFLNQSISLNTSYEDPFTIHFAIWPYIILLSLIAIVWIFVYISTTFSRNHGNKYRHRNFISLYLTDDTGISAI